MAYLKLEQINSTSTSLSFLVSAFDDNGNKTICNNWFGHAHRQKDGVIAYDQIYSTSSLYSTTFTVSNLEPETSYYVYATAVSTATGNTLFAGGLLFITTSALTIYQADMIDVSNIGQSKEMTFMANVSNLSRRHDMVFKANGSTLFTVENLTLTASDSQTISFSNAQVTTLISASANSKTWIAGELGKGVYLELILKEFNGTSTISSDPFITAVIATERTASPILGDNCVIKDTNPTTIQITGDNSKIIRSKSIVTFTFGDVEALYGASISSWAITFGDNSRSGVGSPAGQTIQIGPINIDATSVKFTASVTDSRGFTTYVSKWADMINYASVDLYSASVSRPTTYEDIIVASAYGKYTPLIIDDVDMNEVNLYYRYKQTSSKIWPDEYTQISDSFSFEDGVFEFDTSNWPVQSIFPTENSYNIEFKVSDKLSSDTYTTTLTQSIPVLALRKNKIGVNKSEPESALDVNGNISMNGLNVVGYVRELGDEKLNSIQNSGIFLASQGAFVLTANNYPSAGKTGILEVYGAKRLSKDVATNVVQKYTTNDGEHTYIRVKNASTWSDWHELGQGTEPQETVKSFQFTIQAGSTSAEAPIETGYKVISVISILNGEIAFSDINISSNKITASIAEALDSNVTICGVLSK